MADPKADHKGDVRPDPEVEAVEVKGSSTPA